MSQSPFANFGSRRQKCREGRKIRSMRHLLDVLNTEPSVWFFCKRGPIPCAIVRGWQMQYVISQINGGNLSTVLRPKRPAVLP